MSLKAFHLVFITASMLLLFGFSAWSLNQYFSAGRNAADLAWGAGSIVAGVLLMVYGKYFLKKLKNVEYL